MFKSKQVKSAYLDRRLICMGQQTENTRWRWPSCRSPSSAPSSTMLLPNICCYHTRHTNKSQLFQLFRARSSWYSGTNPPRLDLLPPPDHGIHSRENKLVLNTLKFFFFLPWANRVRLRFVLVPWIRKMIMATWNDEVMWSDRVIGIVQKGG